MNNISRHCRSQCLLRPSLILSNLGGIPSFGYYNVSLSYVCLDLLCSERETDNIGSFLISSNQPL